MTLESPETIYRKECDEVISAISSGDDLVNVVGGPLSLKHEAVQNLISQDMSWVIREFRVSEGSDIDYLFEKIRGELREDRGAVRNWISEIQFGLQMGPLDINTTQTNDRGLLIDELAELCAQAYGDSTTVLVCHDVNLLDTAPERISGKLGELGRELPDDVHILSTSTRKYQSATNIHTENITNTKAADWLQDQFEGIDRDRALSIAKKSSGAPLALKLIANRASSSENIELSSISDTVEDQVEEYVISELTRDERRFLTICCALTELDERVCADVTEFEAIECLDHLNNLQSKHVVRKVGRRNGIARYRIQDSFQSYFHNRSEKAEEVHRYMFHRYVRESIFDEAEDAEEALTPSSLAVSQFEAIYDDPSPEDLLTEIEDLELGTRERWAFSLSTLPILCSQIDDMGPALYREMDRIQPLLDESAEFEPLEVNSYNILRAIARLTVHRFGNSLNDEELEECLKITENALEDLIEKYVDDETILESSDHSLEVISNYVFARGVSDKIFPQIAIASLASSYAHKELGEYEKSEISLYPIRVALHQLEIDWDSAVTIYKRTLQFAKNRGLHQTTKKALKSNIKPIVESFGSQESHKSALYSVQNKMGETWGRAILSTYLEIQRTPMKTAEYVEDIADVLSDGENSPVWTYFWYRTAFQLGLYDNTTLGSFRRMTKLIGASSPNEDSEKHGVGSSSSSKSLDGDSR